MSKHTPAPWHHIVEKDGSVVVYEGTTLQNNDICTMGGNNNDGSNARLIAAAPDLLEALRMAMCYVSNEGSEEEYQQARSAISKATGEAA